MGSYIDSATEKVKTFHDGCDKVTSDLNSIKHDCDKIRDNMVCLAQAKEYAETRGGSAWDKAMNFSEYVYEHDPNSDSD